MLKSDNTQRKRSKGSRRSPGDRSNKVEVADYRHKDEKRKNVPDAGLALYNYKAQEPVKYNYDPHLDPQLVWTGKTERTSVEVETVSLHIHERVSTEAILKSIQKTEPLRQARLFADPDLPLDKRIEFYRHEMDWTNRLILGDSLLVMNSFLEKELMAGKVQTIYMDPPYGIDYKSNFQPQINKREVEDRDEDLTREPEQIQAYRDTWTLGIHSYLTYIRERLLLCHELLSESGSIFVQINDENIHLVRCVLDEVFGRNNFVSQISFVRAGAQTARGLPSVSDYLLWYARDKESLKVREVLVNDGGWAARSRDLWEEDASGARSRLGRGKPRQPAATTLTHRALESATGSESSRFPVEFEGKTFLPKRGWSTNPPGMDRIRNSDRLLAIGNTLRFVVFLDDFPYSTLTNNWTDTIESGFASEKVYAVQTANRVVERCILMTTDPGDLVFDPTCGSGTTAYCAERLGRRWITCDTSRVALAIARRRLMTARFDYYKLADPARGPSSGFTYDTTPKIRLEGIVHNAEIDKIAAKYQTQIDVALAELNRTVKTNWKEWQVPRQPEDAWAQKAKSSHDIFWRLKREKRREITDCIRQSAEPITLYDKPQPENEIVRVSGPFTVEAIPVPVSWTNVTDTSAQAAPAPTTDHVDTLIGLLSKSGVTFTGGKQLMLQNVRPVQSAGFVHAEAEAAQNGSKTRVAISFGPRQSPVTVRQVDEAIRSAYRMGYDLLVLAGFAFDPEAYATVQKNPIPKLTVQMAHISPDVIVGAYSGHPLLKTTKTSQIFTVFGEPDVKLEKTKDEFKVKLLGVDLYDPTTGEIHSNNADDIPAWFLDEDYDGYTFRICQAFFPKGATAKTHGTS